jgi:hypothetical protein
MEPQAPAQAGAGAPRLSDAQLEELLELIKGADSIELKLTVGESDQRSAVAALEMDPLEARIRTVFFFDTPDLDLYEAGVVVRARRTQDKPDDSVVKLRPVVPAELPDDLRESDSFGVEVDAMPGGFVCSGSMKHELKHPIVRETIHGGQPLQKLFSKEQRALYAEHAPEGLDLDDLSVLGPIFVLKLKYSPEGYDRKLVAEMWMYPDNSRILELSTKCRPGEGFEVAAETRVFLSKRGISLDSEQETKTRKALEFFSRQLKESA